MVIKEGRIDAGKLTAFTQLALEKLGVKTDDAAVTAKMLVASDLRGVDSHGVAHLRMFYAKRIRSGIINLKAKPKVFSSYAATAVMDGDQGLGFVVGYQAMNDAIRRANEVGAGFVSVRNSTHYGAAAYYAMMALEHNMIGISLTNTTAGVVAPGTASPAVGTNPIAVAVPAGVKPNFVLDMATSVVAGGKIEVALRKGGTMPEGWLIDGEGKPITDPAKRVRGQGGVLPLGGKPELGAYKGFGLGVLVDILCGVLSGSVAGLLVPRNSDTYGNACDHFFGALKIDSFIPVDNFKKSMDDMINAIEVLPKLPGTKNVYTAGGYEAKVVQDRSENGIPLNPKVVQDLKELAKELNIEYNL